MARNYKSRKNIENKLNLAYTPEKLSERVNILVYYDRMTYAEALTQICEDHEIDPRDLAQLVIATPALYEKVRAEATRNRVIPNENRGSLIDLL